MENDVQGVQFADSASSAAYLSRTEARQRRVNDAARAMSERGIRPTVTRIRAALGGGSPNDLAPALKHWKESFGSAAPMGVAGTDAPLSIPVQIADLAHELWQRASAAAIVELKGGPTARQAVMRTEETESLRQQVDSLRNQLQRESLAFGELRAQAARYEAMARDAFARVDEADTRERKCLRNLGTARQRIAELEAAMNQLRERPPAAPQSPRRKQSAKKPRPPKPVKVRPKKSHAAKPVRTKVKVISRVLAARRRRVRRRSR
jgi:plasmid replication DNA-binding protein KfrA